MLPFLVCHRQPLTEPPCRQKSSHRRQPQAQLVGDGHRYTQSGITTAPSNQRQLQAQSIKHARSYSQSETSTASCNQRPAKVQRTRDTHKYMQSAPSNQRKSPPPPSRDGQRDIQSRSYEVQRTQNLGLLSKLGHRPH